MGQALTRHLREFWKSLGGDDEDVMGPGYKLLHPHYPKRGGVTFIETARDFETFKRFYCLRIDSTEKWEEIYRKITDKFNLDTARKGNREIIRAYPKSFDTDILEHFLVMSLEYWTGQSYSYTRHGPASLPDVRKAPEIENKLETKKVETAEPAEKKEMSAQTAVSAEVSISSNFKLYSYIVRYDTGFAPNPFGGYLSLACCKPVIRRTAQVGDWVLGVGGASLCKGRIIFLMRVDEVMTFNEYYHDERFQAKKSSVEASHGDNIYHQESGKWIQDANPWHGEDDIAYDTKTNRVLVSNKFWYFGKDAIDIPDQFRALGRLGRGHKIYPKFASFNAKQLNSFLKYIAETYPPGIIGQPHGKIKKT